MSDAIGAMRARVTLQQPTRIADEIGGAAILWTSAGDVWAEIAAGGVSEAADDGAVRAATTYTLTINRRDDVRAGWRVLWGGRRLRVVGVRDAGGPRVALICEEEIL